MSRSTIIYWTLIAILSPWSDIRPVSSFTIPRSGLGLGLGLGLGPDVQVDPRARPVIGIHTRPVSHILTLRRRLGSGTFLAATATDMQEANENESDATDANADANAMPMQTKEGALPDTDKLIEMADTDDILSFSELGGFDPSKKIPIKREVLVGNPQQLKIKKKEKSVTAILQELAAIQAQGPRKYCILGTRHCSYLHQQIIELLSYALVLSENHVYTSGAGGTNAAAIRGALRAERPDLLTVILPQSLQKQEDESQELLKDVTDLITMPQNDDMSLDVASRLCNSKLLSETDQLIAFAFHESKTVIEATKEAKKLEMLVTMLFLD